MAEYPHDKLAELVYLTLGRASMCWSEIPKGVYDDVCAHKLGEELLRAIYQHEQEAIQNIIRDGQGNIIAQSKSFFVPVEGGENAV